MLLKKVFRDSGETLNEKYESLEINKIHYDSRKIEKGDLFVAVKGYQVDGHNFLRQVYEKGAAAAVVEKVNPQVELKQITVRNSRKTMAWLAYNYYRTSLEKLDLIGITGTNGKTTCSYLIQSVLQAAGISCGLAGTIHYIIGTEKINAWNTTPEAIDLYEMLHQMYLAGNRACVLEVSSHALALNRVTGLKFKVAVFTNLSRDHMDFHSNMEDYFSEKRKLFSQLSSDGVAVFNNDDSYGKYFEKEERKLSFGFDNTSAVYPAAWETDAHGTRMEIVSGQSKFAINSPLVGTFNVYNILAAVTAGLALNIAAGNIKSGIASLQSVPGRLEKYMLKNGAMAIIDYAHTPDALENALRTVRKITSKKLICVFGCGGDRDKGKRPQMGQVAQSYSDIVFVTDDNPRSEESLNIINDILKGMEENKNTFSIADRREAIRQALKCASAGDVVLIAGKGHETYQIIGKEKKDFNEAEIIREIDNA